MTATGPGRPAGGEPQGAGPEPAGWHDEAQVAWYLQRIEGLEPRVAGERAMAEVVPASARRAVDLGCGDGRLTAVLLEAAPQLEQVVAADRSEPMLERARRRFADETRVRVVHHDLTHDVHPLGRADVVVSGFAIHHLTDDRKRALFGEVARALRPGGTFANLEVVASGSPRRHAEFLAAIGRRADDPEDRLAPVEAQLTWMAEAGLEHVDCLWRWRGFALLVGEAPAGR